MEAAGRSIRNVGTNLRNYTSQRNLPTGVTRHTVVRGASYVEGTTLCQLCSRNNTVHLAYSTQGSTFHPVKYVTHFCSLLYCLFSDAVSIYTNYHRCWTRKWSIEITYWHWKLKHSDKNLTQCHLGNHTSNIAALRIASRPTPWAGKDWFLSSFLPSFLFGLNFKSSSPTVCQHSDCAYG